MYHGLKSCENDIQRFWKDIRKNFKWIENEDPKCKLETSKAFQKFKWSKRNLSAAMVDFCHKYYWKVATKIQEMLKKTQINYLGGRITSP